MRNFARRSFFLSLTVVIVSFSQVEPQVAEKANLTNSGGSCIQTNGLTNDGTGIKSDESRLNDNLTSNSNSSSTLNSDKTFTSNSDEKMNSEKANSEKTKMRTFVATAYCLKGRTASGRQVQRGIIAADPRVLPLGSVVQIEAGSYSGTYVVADTGGKVKGNKVDIWVPKCREAVIFGKRLVKLTVISKR